MPTEANYPRATPLTGWRSALIRLILPSLALLASTVVATGLARVLVPPAPSPLHQWILLKNLLLPMILVTAYAYCIRALEHRSASEIALRRGLRLFPLGVILGIVLIAGYVAVLLGVGGAHLASGTSLTGIGNILNEVLVPWLTAVGEELLFRAVLFRIAEEIVGSAGAIAISAALFALAHAANPAANPAALLCLGAGMGVVLALAFSVTRNLWFPIGLHMGWNLAEGFLFGLPNSGLTDPLHLATTVVSGPVALTGGGFGPEGSVILLALTLGVSAILVRAALRTQWRPRRCNVHSRVDAVGPRS